MPASGRVTAPCRVAAKFRQRAFPPTLRKSRRERRRQILRQWTKRFHPPTPPGKSQAPGMQSRTSQAENLLCRPVRRPVAVIVVTENGTGQRRRVHPNLVRPALPGVECQKPGLEGRPPFREFVGTV